MKGIPEVLFVCVHNAGRSQMAAAFLDRLAAGRVHVRSALRGVNGYLKNMIEAIANAKLRRMERELELRGIHFDRADDNGMTRNSDRTSRRED